MKNYTYYLLMYALGGSIGVGHAMNTGNEYFVTKLTLPLETLKINDSDFYKEYMKAEGDYHEAELKLKQAQDDLEKAQREDELCIKGQRDNAENLEQAKKQLDQVKQAKKQLDQVKQAQKKIRDEYKETEAFKKYHEQVCAISGALKKQKKIDNQHVVPSDVEDSRGNALFSKLCDIDKQRERQRPDLNDKKFCINITVENPKTNQSIDLPPPDVGSAQYKEIHRMCTANHNPEIDKKKKMFYNESENKAYHDALEDLRKAKVVMEFSKKEVEEAYAKLSWLNKAWLNFRGRNPYKKDIAYHTRALSDLDNEIDSFIKEDYTKNQHKNRDAFSRSFMLIYAENDKEAEGLFRDLKHARNEQYVALKSNNRSVNE